MSEFKITTPSGARALLASCKTSPEKFEAKQKLKRVNSYNEKTGEPGWLAAILRDA